MCGGTLEIAPCSHVGHIFRKSTPYSFPGGTSRIVNHNNARLAEVWLDQWKEFYFSINPGVSPRCCVVLTLCGCGLSHHVLLWLTLVAGFRVGGQGEVTGKTGGLD